MKKVVAAICVFLQVLLIFKDMNAAWKQHILASKPLIADSLLKPVTYPYFAVSLTLIPFAVLSYYLYRKQYLALCILLSIAVAIWEYWALIIFS